MSHFSVDAVVFERRPRGERLTFCLIRGHWVASCEAPGPAPGMCLSIGHPVPDELSLFSFKDHIEEASHGQDTPSLSFPANRHTPVVPHPLHFENRSSRGSSSTGVLYACVCVCPSFPRSLNTHTCSLVTGSRCFLAQTQAAATTTKPPPLPPQPNLTPAPIFCSALRHLCVVRQMGRKAGGTSESTVGTEQGGPHSRVI